jgi:hypothetical protein
MKCGRTQSLPYFMHFMQRMDKKGAQKDLSFRKLLCTVKFNLNINSSIFASQITISVLIFNTYWYRTLIQRFRDEYLRIVTRLFSIK